MKFESFQENEALSKKEKPLFIDLENGFLEIEGNYAEYVPRELEEDPVGYFKNMARR